MVLAIVGFENEQRRGALLQQVRDRVGPDVSEGGLGHPEAAIGVGRALDQGVCATGLAGVVVKGEVLQLRHDHGIGRRPGDVARDAGANARGVGAHEANA